MPHTFREPSLAQKIAFWGRRPRALAARLRQSVDTLSVDYGVGLSARGDGAAPATTDNSDFVPLTESLSAAKAKALSDLPTMDALFQEHLPTKQGHNYNPQYERHFTAARLDVRRVLEIGVEAGTSLRFWKDYFPNAEIVGFDINERCKEHEDDRIKIVIGDQNNVQDLGRVPDGLDIVIDDGLHTQQSQIGCFRYLYPNKMSTRGTYVVEDIVGGQRTVDFFLGIARLTNLWPKDLPGSRWSSFDSADLFSSELGALTPEDQYYLLNTIGVAVYRHAIFIDKGRNPEDGQAAFRLRHPEMWREVGSVRNDWLHNKNDE